MGRLAIDFFLPAAHHVTASLAALPLLLCVETALQSAGSCLGGRPSIGAVL